MSARMAIYVGRGHSLPIDIALSLIPSLPRAHLEQLVQRLVDGLDEQDGDPDLEDATDAEDDFSLSDQALCSRDTGPGCVLADQDLAVDDQLCDHIEPEALGIPLYGKDQSAPTGWRLV